MTQAISARLKSEADRALRTLEASGLSRNEAIRSALVDAARRLGQRSELAAEVAAHEADEAEEMIAAAGLMGRSGLRGSICQPKLPKGVGHGQHREHCGVVVQVDEMPPRSVVLIAPISRSARAASFHPEIEVEEVPTRVLVEQVGAVDVWCHGTLSGHLTARSSGHFDDALLTVLGPDSATTPALTSQSLSAVTYV